MSRYRVYHAINNFLAFVGDCLFFRIRRGNAIQRLEQSVANQLSVTHAIALPMARMGIYLTLKHLNLSGKRVLLSPYTIADVINMVTLAGAKPEFVDVEPTTGMISRVAVEQAVNRYDDIGAVLVTHLHGLPCEIESIHRLCQAKSIALIEDAAQAFGATLANGRPLGTIGKAGVFSLGTYKHLNAVFGGILITDDSELTTTIRDELATFPFFPTREIRKKVLFALVYDFLIWPPLFRWMVFPWIRKGLLNNIESINKHFRIELDTQQKSSLPPSYQSRMTPYQARCALRQIPYLKQDSARRIHSARRYHEALLNTEISLPPFEVGGIYTYYPLVWEGAQEYIKWAAYFGQDLVAQHLKNCASLESFKEFARNCPQATFVAKNMLLLPTYPSYTDEQVQRNINVLNWFLAQQQPAFSWPAAKRLLKERDRKSIQPPGAVRSIKRI